MTDYADLEIHILPRTDDGYPIRAKLSNGSKFNDVLAPDLLPWQTSGDPVTDGRRLFAALFRDGLHADAPELHALPWESLRDPASDLDLAAAVVLNLRLMKPNTPLDDKSFPQLEALIDTLALITEQMRGRDAKFCVSTASAR